MFKKFLTIAMAVGMLLTLMCSIPVSATVNSGPYQIQDFETDDTNLFRNLPKAEGAEGYKSLGTGISKGTSATEVTAINLVDMEYTDTASIRPGDTITVSFKYKLLAPLVSDSKMTVISSYFTNEVPDGDTWKYTTNWAQKSTALADPSDTTNWQTFTTKISIPSTAVFNKKGNYYSSLLYLRWGGGQSSKVTLATAGTVGGAYIDDIVVTKETFQGKEVYDGSNKDLTGTYKDSYSKNVADPTDPSNKVYSTLPGNNGGAYNLLTPHFSMSSACVLPAGETVTVSAKVMVSDNHHTGMVQAKAMLYDDTSYATAHRVFNDSTSDSLKIDMTDRQWQTISTTFTATEDTTIHGARFWITDESNTYADDNPKKDMYATYYFDDITVSIDSIAVFVPEISNVIATRDEAGLVTLTYDTTMPEAVNGYVYKLISNGGIIQSGTLGGGTDIVVPEAYLDTDVSIEIIPASGRYMGAIAIAPVVKELDFTTEFASTNFSTNVFKVSYSLQNCTRTENDINAILVIVAYSDSYEIIDYYEEYIYCENTLTSPSPTTGNCELKAGVNGKLTALSENGTEDIAHVCAYLWDCGDNTTPTVFDTTMKELTTTAVAHKVAE